MDRINTILQSQWRAYWRRFRRAGNLSANNLGLVVLLGGLGLIRYFQQIPLAATQLAKGETPRYQTLLILVFLAWMVPILGESRRSISSRNLLHFPLSTGDLFLIRLASAFLSPFSWMIVAGSLALCYPVALSPHRAVGTLALLTFLLLGLFTSMVFTQLLSNAVVRKLALAGLLVLSAVIGVLWFGQQTIPARSLWWLPHRLAASAAVSPSPFRAFAMLVGMMLLAAMISFWTFPLTLQPPQHRRSQRLALSRLIQFPGKFGGLIKKDLRYFSRLLDVYLALPIVILSNMYLVTNPTPSAFVFYVVVVLLFLPCLSLVLNCFGLDSPLGLDRYALLPLSDKEKLLSKNLAFLGMMVVMFGTIVPFSLFRLGAYVTLLGFLELLVIALAYATYGNWLSTKHPFRMQFYRFASGGSLVDDVMGVLFGSLPGAVCFVLLYRGSEAALLLILLMTLLYLALYVLSLRWSGRALGNALLDRMTGFAGFLLLLILKIL